MPAPFAQLTVAEFAELLARFSFTRKVNAVHMHHTWRPNHAQYRGHETIVSMWRYHTQQNRWSDIAQHVTIAPDGSIWLGRNWNQPPASAAGHNGNRQAGPFMFEIIGDFDVGKDPFDGAQREAVFQVIVLVQQHFGLAPETLVFHNMMSTKTCPGSAIAYDACVEEVRKRQARGRRGAEARALRRRDLPFAEDMTATAGHVARALELLARDVPGVGDEPADAEHEAHSEIALEAHARGGLEFRPGLTVEMLDALRPHVINLRMGRFSQDGLMVTAADDVDALFDDHLERALREVKASDPDGRLRLLFYAHGGLVAESAGLRIAHKHLGWWRANGVYPINFVWETGLWETFGDLLRKIRGQGQRSIVADYLTDPLIEAALRVLPAEQIWTAMKYAAELSSARGGGARYAAERLKAFVDRHGDDVELHAVGHSAGSIFHSHFVPACHALGLPPFRTLQFLAPAVRVDTFLGQLGKLIGAGKGVDQLTLFTMRKQYELEDNCFQIYRKSLLYLVAASAESERDTALLGLEVSLRSNSATRALFGLDGGPGGDGEVVWSTTAHAEGRSASRSTSHGGFDDDPATLSSVVRRVLGKADADPVAPYVPLAAEAGRGIGDGVDWPEPLRTAPGGSVPTRTGWGASAAAGPGAVAAVGRRRAVCIGIDEYAIRPLAGCVADARLWAEALQDLGFEPPTVLVNGAATRSAILGAIGDAIGAAAAGDVVVVQFAGHGTQVPDLDGDEAGGDTPGLDEALCPIDFPDGAFVIDDDLATLCDRIPDGVNVTFFVDCCHSGTVTRLALGPPGGAGAAVDERPRFLAATEAMKAAHIRFRTALGPGAGRGASLAERREVLFSACRSDEVAWESNGHGEFTVRATDVLRRGVEGLTHERFHARVLEAFGPHARQHPELHCAATASGRPLLGAFVGASRPPAGAAAVRPAGDGLLGELEALLQRHRQQPGRG